MYQQIQSENESRILDMIIQSLQDNERRNKPCTKEFLSSLKLEPISETCSICMEGDNYDGIKLSCKHSFHHKCIMPWLELNNTCPVCRKEFPTEAETSSDVIHPRPPINDDEEVWDPFYG